MSDFNDFGRDFERGFIRAFVGYAIGAWIDQTRFGVWFNTNPVINTIWFVGKLALIGTGIVLGTWLAIDIIAAFAN